MIIHTCSSFGRKILPSLMVVFYFGPLPVPGKIISWSEVNSNALSVLFLIFALTMTHFSERLAKLDMFSNRGNRRHTLSYECDQEKKIHFNSLFNNLGAIVRNGLYNLSHQTFSFSVHIWDSPEQVTEQRFKFTRVKFVTIRHLFFVLTNIFRFIQTYGQAQHIYYNLFIYIEPEANLYNKIPLMWILSSILMLETH